MTITASTRKPAQIAWAAHDAPDGTRSEISRWVGGHLEMDELRSIATEWLVAEASALKRRRSHAAEVESEVLGSSRVRAHMRYQDERNDAADKIISKLGELRPDVDAIIHIHKERTPVEWTPAILQMAIAFRDGTRTTWGEATLEQHQERADIFAKNATANIEGAARHHRAIETIESAGVSCLNEAVAHAG